MLAVLKAGGAFVPLDPSHPVERLRGLCESVEANIVLCSRHLVEMLATVSGTVLPIDEATVAEPEQAEPEGSATSMHTACSTNAAYVIFTSGSTGKPKVSDHTGISPLAHSSPKNEQKIS